MGLLFQAFGGMSLLARMITILSLIGVVLTAYGVWHHKVYMKGWNDHVAAIARQDARAIAAARAARDKFNECRAGGLPWDQSTGQCIGR